MEFDLGDLLEREEDLEQELRDISQKYGMNPVHLKEIVRYSSKGLSQSDISEKVGVSRNTVRKYRSKLGSMKKSDFKKLVLITSLLFGGFYFFYEMLSE